MRITALAKLISNASHPVLTFPLSIVLLFSSQKDWLGLGVVFFLAFLVPFSFFIGLWATKRISDFDISLREQRYSVYTLGLVGMGASGVFLYFSASPFLFQQWLTIFLVSLLFLGLNFITKISIHTGAAMLVVIFLTQLYHWSPWVFLVIPVIALSRVLLKRHTPLEVALGATLPLIALVPAFV